MLTKQRTRLRRKHTAKAPLTAGTTRIPSAGLLCFPGRKHRHNISTRTVPTAEARMYVHAEVRDV